MYRGRSPDLLCQPERDITSLIADDAYDGEPVHQAAAIRKPGQLLDVVIPLRACAGLGTVDLGKHSRRERYIQLMAGHGRMAWQCMNGYGRRNAAETVICRYKRLIGPRLRARKATAQASGVAPAVPVLNRMIHKAKPVPTRRP